MSSPSDEELLQAVKILRTLHPHLARAKLLTLLKDDNSWALSDARLKKCVEKHSLKAQPENESVDLPRDEAFEAVVKDAFNDFKLRERDFMLALSREQSLKLNEGQRVDPMYGACHLRHHIEILLVLKGVKPCTLIAHHIAQEIFTEMVDRCLEPVMRRYKLAKYGFILQSINHPMPTTVHRGFQHAWIFADTSHSLWPKVNSVFLTPHQEPVDELDIGVALGYPTPDGSREFAVVDYTEMVEMKTTTQKHVCCVSAYEFTCPPSAVHFRDIMFHFNRCFTAAKEVGTDLRLNPVDLPEFAAWITQSQGGPR